MNVRTVYEWTDTGGALHRSVIHHASLADARRHGDRAYSPTSNWRIELRSYVGGPWVEVAR